MRPVQLLLILSLLLLPACGSFYYQRVRRFEPVPEGVTARLEKERAGFQACLTTLGAPKIVWELPEGLALAYAWMDKSFWRLNVTSPRISNYSQTVFQYGSTSQDFHGVVLLFDDNLTLQTVRRGYLGDITKELQNPPAYIED